MSALFRMESLTACVFSFDQDLREVLVLRAYFDDSGTHDYSHAVAMGGLIATAEAWAALEPAWMKLRDELGITKMHMSPCVKGRNEFKGWSEERRDAAIEAFRSLIVATGGRMIARVVSRSTWEAVCAVSRLSEAFADPIDFLCATCIRRSLETKRASTVGREQVAVVFDCRQQSVKPWNMMASGFEKRWPEQFVGYSFGNMEKVLPLQAADMIAYEAFVFHIDRDRLGREPAPRPNFAKLMDELSHDLAFYTEENLLAYARELEG